MARHGSCKLPGLEIKKIHSKSKGPNLQWNKTMAFIAINILFWEVTPTSPELTQLSKLHRRPRAAGGWAQLAELFRHKCQEPWNGAKYWTNGKGTTDHGFMFFVRLKFTSLKLYPQLSKQHSGPWSHHMVLKSFHAILSPNDEGHVLGFVHVCRSHPVTSNHIPF